MDARLNRPYETTPHEGFESGSVLFGAVMAFMYSFPYVSVGALAASALLALAFTLRRV